MKTSNIKAGDYIYTNGIFGEKPYAVLDVEHKKHGAIVNTHFGTATFSMLLGDSNWRFATNADF